MFIFRTIVNRPLHFFGLFLAMALSGAFAQYEDLSNLSSSSVAAGKGGLFSTLKGVKITRQEGEKGAKDVSITFLFSGKPSNFFNYYDAQKKAIIFDFYDTHKGKAVLDTLHESPITHSSLDSLQIDLNKDAKGMAPDIRDVARVSLFTAYNVDYEVQEAAGSVTLNYKWSPKIEAGFTSKNKAKYWQIPLAVGVAGGAGFAGYELFLKKSPAASTNPLDGTPPSHPSGQ